MRRNWPRLAATAAGFDEETKLAKKLAMGALDREN